MICIPIKQKSLKNLLKDFFQVQKIGNIIEIWFDELNIKLNKKILSEILKNKKKPIIYKFTGNKENLEILIRSQKIDFIDLDVKTSTKIINKIKKESPRTKIIISYHNFLSTPEISTLKRIIKKMYALKADITKIATYAKKESDSIKILSLLSEISISGKKIICLAMGEKGRLTRMCGHLFGNYLMYAPLRSSGKTADGQITADELKKIMDINK